MIKPFLLGLAVMITACTSYPDPTEPVERKLTARRVRLDVEQGSSNVVVKGDVLRLDLETLEMNLEGNASVTIDEPISLRADAATIAFGESFEIVELVGDVHAYMGRAKQDTIHGEPKNR